MARRLHLEKKGGGLVGGHNSEGGNVQQFGTKRGQGNRKWIQKRRESLKGFPFSANLVCECASPPPSLNSPLRLSHTNRTIICYLDSDKEEENKKERGGRIEEGERKGAFTNTDVQLFHLSAAPHHYCSLHLPYDFKSCSNSSHTGCGIVILLAM